jgi:hypothetical protein
MATSDTGYGQGKMPALGAHLMSAGYYTATLSGAITLTMAYQNFLKLDPGGGNKNVTLPAEEGNSGAWFYINNTADAGESLAVKDDGGSTIVTISQNEAAIVVCDGSAWAHMGIITIALT